jgi:hypothetical protein
VQRTLLAREDGPVRMPRRLRIGLEFGRRRTAVDAVERVLARAGFPSAEHLRAAFALPHTRLLCRPFVPGSGELARLGDAPVLVVLEQALLLGLCTAHMYDPARPVVWTTTSLTRRLELFEPEGFYVS